MNVSFYYSLNHMYNSITILSVNCIEKINSFNSHFEIALPICKSFYYSSAEKNVYKKVFEMPLIIARKAFWFHQVKCLERLKEKKNCVSLFSPSK